MSNGQIVQILRSNRDFLIFRNVYTIFFSIASFWCEIEAPIVSNRLAIHLTSAICGTLLSTYFPGASSEAAIIFNTEFFAPDTLTVPDKPVDCWTRITEPSSLCEEVVPNSEEKELLATI